MSLIHVYSILFKYVEQVLMGTLFTCLSKLYEQSNVNIARRNLTLINHIIMLNQCWWLNCLQ